MDKPNVIRVSINQCLTKLALTMAFMTGAPAIAEDFECQSNADWRYIRLEIPGREHLCEVTVTKKDNNREVKWYANQNTIFCSEKLIELKNKHTNEWGYNCVSQPDQTGIDSLTRRQRAVLDAELKQLIELGKTASEPFVIGGLNAVANPPADEKSSMMVFQYFVADILTGNQKDITQVIEDNGLSWRTVFRIDNLANFVDVQEGYRVNGALVSAISDVGTLDIITDIDTSNSSKQQVLINGDVTNQDAQCFGSLKLEPQTDGGLKPSTPHKLTCQATSTTANDAG